MKILSPFRARPIQLLTVILLYAVSMGSFADLQHHLENGQQTLINAGDHAGIKLKVDRHLSQLGEDISGMTQEIEEMVKSLRKMADKHRVDDAFLGILLDDHHNDEKGILLLGVTPEGPAQQAGLKADDIILEINDQSMHKEGELSPARKMSRSLKAVKPGQTISLMIERDGEKKPFTLTVGKRGDHLQHGVNFLADDLEKRLQKKFMSGSHKGELDDMDFDLEDELEDIELYPVSPSLGRYFNSGQGLLVLRAPVDNQLSLQEGDVLIKIGDRAPKSASQAWRILQSYDSGEMLELTLMRDQNELRVNVKRP